MCSVQGGVQLLKDAAGLVVSPMAFLTKKVAASRSILLDEEEASSSDDSDDEDSKNAALPDSEIPVAKTTHPQTLSFEAPADAVPGMPVCVQGPHGPLRLPLPDDVQPGKLCSIRLGPEDEYTVPVPEGVEPGALISFQGHHGETLHATLPPGLKAGDEFKVSPRVLLVQVPAGVKPGQHVSYVSPFGQQLFAAVPPGLAPGHYFAALFDAPLPSEEATPVPNTMSVEPRKTEETTAVEACPVSAPPTDRVAAMASSSAEMAGYSPAPVDEVEAPSEEAKSSGEEATKCADCGTILPACQKFCGECGTKRPTAATSETAHTVAPASSELCLSSSSTAPAVGHATPCSAVGAADSELPECNSNFITLEATGKMSMTVDGGRVTSVNPEGQARRLGVQVGWTIQRLDDVDYSFDLLRQKALDGTPFRISFEQTPAAANAAVDAAGERAPAVDKADDDRAAIAEKTE